MSSRAMTERERVEVGNRVSESETIEVSVNELLTVSVDVGDDWSRREDKPSELNVETRTVRSERDEELTEVDDSSRNQSKSRGDVEGPSITLVGARSSEIGDDLLEGVRTGLEIQEEDARDATDLRE